MSEKYTFHDAARLIESLEGLSKQRRRDLLSTERSVRWVFIPFAILVRVRYVNAFSSRAAILAYEFTACFM